MGKLVIKSRYGIVPNELLNDPNISLKAKGLFAYLQSKPDGWSFSREKISRQTKDGRDSISSALQELEENGYLQRIQVRNQNGIFTGYDYVLHETGYDRKPVGGKVTGGKTTGGKDADISNKDNSKGEVSKKEKTKEINFFEEKIPQQLKNNGFVEVWKDWVKHRKQIKKP